MLEEKLSYKTAHKLLMKPEFIYIMKCDIRFKIKAIMLKIIKIT